ncbi:MAG TPA: PAS domain-containing protein, partial [Flavisolibacter sp.]|nr:PAS domain-containing protein [Flavisolibacter sp.]
MANRYNDIVAVQVQSQTIPLASINNLRLLPSFADFLLTQKLHELAEVQLRILQEVKPPMLKYYENLSPEQLLEYTRQRLTVVLSYLKENKASEQITAQLEEWEQNRLIVNKDDVIAEDITLISYLRKKTFLYFLPDYTSDTEEILGIIRELDFYLLHAQNAATDFYINQFRKKINEHTHFIERITNTTPGIIYVFDMVNNREVYANKSTADFLGYSPEELKQMGNRMVAELMHPEDQERLKVYDTEFAGINDGEAKTFRYRMRNKNGEYRWLRTTETVFRRNEKGEIIEKIGIAIDVHEQKMVADELNKKEQLYRQAQALAHVGNWSWNIGSEQIYWSDELFRIYGLEPSAYITYSQFINAVHPDDREELKNKVATSIETLQPYEILHRIVLPDGNIRILNGRGEVIKGADQRPLMLVGTAQDVTERELLIKRLEESDLLYKQAQSLAKVGNYNCNLQTGAITWSDELFRIYGLEPQSENITLDIYKSFVHPDDIALMEERITDAIKNRRPGLGTVRIIRRDGSIRYVESVGEVIEDGIGNLLMIGIAQDVTEKQLMIEQLQRSE